MKNRKRLIALALCGVTVFSMAGCGSEKTASAGKDTSYTMWIYSGADASYYTDYADNPVLQYAFGKTWGSEEKAVDIEFWVPPAGTETDNYSTMMTSGDYPDILDGSISASPKTMYEDGIILDLTQYVNDYMPNYKAFLEEHSEVKANAVVNIDGEDKILAIRSAYESYPYYFNGYQYRRDWLVKYGTNPETGEAFTGGYTDENDVDSWEDDVVFPSGGSDPVYISDWEWMFEIFAKALEDLGIDDSYCISTYYPGFTWSGGLCSCFGGGVPVWYADENNQVQFGGDSEQFRAYLECMNSWYENGWLDEAFNERTSDIFYAIDDTSVRQGKVGMWVGVESELGGRLDMDDEYTDGICVYGCAFPINDVYGTEECQNVEPTCVMTSSLTNTAYYFTSKMAEKNIEAICSMMDYFYSEEGSLVYSLGLNAEQVKETDCQLYRDWGMEDGAYTIGEDGRYVRSDVIVNDSGSLKTACRLEKFPGICLVESIDEGYAENYENALKSWIQYKNEGFFQGTPVTTNMTNEDANVTDTLRTKVIEYMSVNAVDFIKGKKDISNDKDWNDWCTMLSKYNYQKASDIYQPYLDSYSFK